MRRYRLLLGCGAIAASIGVGLALTIAYIHAQLDTSGAAYTSFCNVNSQINCDSVLSSPFAKILGIPVAWPAAALYTLVALLLALAARDGVIGKRGWALQAATITVVGSSAFVLYMAWVSFAVLATACLMCMGLYAVTAVLLVVVLRAPRQLERSDDTSATYLSGRWLVAVFMVSAAVVASIAAATWPGVAQLPASALSLDAIRKADPEFYRWYMSQPVVSVDEEGLSVSGDADAPVVIVEFSDFQCTYCLRSHRLLKDLLERKPGSVRIIHRHFPLDKTCNVALDKTIHALACRAAEAAECGARQGRYEVLADSLFRHQRQLFENNLFRLAERAGLDMQAFRQCMQSGEALATIRDDTRVGSHLEISSTPTLFINGRRIDGTFEEPSGYDYAVLIETLLARGSRPIEAR